MDKLEYAKSIENYEQDQEQKPPIFRTCDNNFYEIRTKQHIYTYCKCLKIKTVRNHDAILILVQNLIRPVAYLSYNWNQDRKIQFRVEDLRHFQNKSVDSKEIELSIISVVTLKKVRLTFSFINKEEKEWELQFQSEQMAKLAHDFIYRKQVQMKEKQTLSKAKREQQILQLQRKKSEKREKKQQLKKVAEQQLTLTASTTEQLDKDSLNSGQKQKDFEVIKSIQKKQEEYVILIQISTLNEKFESMLNNQHVDFRSKIDFITCNMQALKLRIQQQIKKLKQRHQQQIKVLSDKIEQSKEQIVEVQKQSESDKQQLIHSHQVIQQVSNERIQQLTLQLSQKYDELKTFQQKDILLSRQIYELQEIKSEKDLLVAQHSKTKEQLQRMNESNKLNSQKVQSLYEHIREIEQSKRKLQSQKIEIEQKYISVITQLKTKLSQCDQELQESKKFIQKLLSDSKLKQKQSIDLLSQLKQSNLQSMFKNKILDGYNTIKGYLIDEINTYTKQKIHHTKLIYQFDQLNKNNFHLYIDQIPDIVLVVKISTGPVLAAFTQSPFHKDKIANRGGLIMSLTRRKTFKLQPGKKSVSYDDYYMIFGNSQIRLKSLEKKIFSNFGISSGFYETKGCKVDELLSDGGNREVEMDSYEVHQLFYE